MDCLEQSGSHHLLTDRILINEDHRVLLTITVCGCMYASLLSSTFHPTSPHLHLRIHHLISSHTPPPSSTHSSHPPSTPPHPIRSIRIALSTHTQSPPIKLATRTTRRNIHFRGTTPAGQPASHSLRSQQPTSHSSPRCTHPTSPAAYQPADGHVIVIVPRRATATCLSSAPRHAARSTAERNVLTCIFASDLRAHKDICLPPASQQASRLSSLLFPILRLLHTATAAGRCRCRARGVSQRELAWLLACTGGSLRVRQADVWIPSSYLAFAGRVCDGHLQSLAARVCVEDVQW